jgi:hypothetical protein
MKKVDEAVTVNMKEKSLTMKENLFTSSTLANLA